MSCRCDVCTSGDDPRYIGMACREASKPACPFCGGTRSDGMLVHAWDCEWCTLLQRVQRLQDTQTFLIERLEYYLALTLPKESNGSSEATPDTQRSGEPERRCSECDERLTGERHWCAPDRAPELHPDASPAEPGGAPDAGADAASRGPASSEPGS